MSGLPDIVARARDLVDAYEELITRVKILRIEVIEQPEKIDSFLPRLEKIIKETAEFLETYSGIEYDMNDYYGKYLKTYYNYLLMVSIPYLIDLLNEVRANIDQSKKHLVEENIAKLSSFTRKYKSTFDNIDKSTP